MEHLPIDQIGYDSKYYPRVNGTEDWFTANRYKEAIICHPWKADARKPGAFPPVILVRATGYKWPYLLLDGLHRLRAFSNAKQEKIWAEVERLPQSKWLARSVELNIASKRPLDSGDKRWAAKRLLEEGWNKEKIAGLLEMETASFEKLMSTGIQKLTRSASSDIPEGRSNRKVNGDSYGFLKSPLTEATGTANALQALKSQSAVSSRDAVQIVDSFLALLESGCVDLTDEELVNRLEVAQKLLGETLTGATA